MTPEIVYNPAYVARLPAGHRFPMPKFRALRDALAMRGLLPPARLHIAEPAPERWIELAHDEAYVADILALRLDAAKIRRLGLPMNETVAQRSRAAVAGTVLTARLALETGLACNLAGGSHHAHAGFGAGFCVFNDVAVAARLLLAEGTIRRALVIDLDVHQGDGTAAILAHDRAVTTFSVHCRTNFPARKAQSDLDIALDPDTGDDAYRRIVAAVLPGLLERSAPDLVFYNAGVDPHRDDRLGRLALTDQGLAERENLVLDSCRRRGLPVACVVGGGYAHQIEEVARRHALLHEVARDLPPW